MESWFPLLRLHPRLVDAAVGAWVAAWIVLGIVAGSEIRDLRTFGDTLAESGTAIDTAGAALETLGAVPVIGDGPGRLGEQVRSTAARVQESALETKNSVDTLSVVLAVAIVFMPTIPVLSVYLPWRVTRGKQLEAMRQVLAASDTDPAVEEFLARRAVQQLPYDTLLAVTPTPWRDIEDGRFRALANAELTRIGLATAAPPRARRRSAPTG